MKQALIETSQFAQELTTCPNCMAILTRYEFGTDHLGRTMSLCPNCGPALLPLRRGAPRLREKPQGIRTPCGTCKDCPATLYYSMNGVRPKRCPACARERGRVRDLKRYHAVHAKRARLHA